MSTHVPFIKSPQVDASVAPCNNFILLLPDCRCILAYYLSSHTCRHGRRQKRTNLLDRSSSKRNLKNFTNCVDLTSMSSASFLKCSLLLTVNFVQCIFYMPKLSLACITFYRELNRALRNIFFPIFSIQLSWPEINVSIWKCGHQFQFTCSLSISLGEIILFSPRYNWFFFSFKFRRVHTNLLHVTYKFNVSVIYFLSHFAWMIYNLIKLSMSIEPLRNHENCNFYVVGFEFL